MSQLQDGRAAYDAAGRMTRYRDVAQYGGADNVDKAWTYDAADNVRSIITTYRPMQANGSLTIGTTTQTLGVGIQNKQSRCKAIGSDRLKICTTCRNSTSNLRK